MRSAIDWMARSPLRAFIIIFLLGMTIRLFFLAKVPDNYILPHDRWEDRAIATALVERGQFADPYMIPTGPTAHLAPIVPGVVALFWCIFGMGLAGGYAHRPSYGAVERGFGRTSRHCKCTGFDGTSEPCQTPFKQ